MNERRLTHVIRLLTRHSWSIEELTIFFQVDRRTVRRWLEAIEERGLRIVREGVYPTSPYRILRKIKGFRG